MAYYQADKCELSDFNVVFLVDSSSSLSRSDFITVRNYLTEAIQNTFVSTRFIPKDNINVAVIGFAGSADVYFDWQNADTESLFQMINNIDYLGDFSQPETDLRTTLFFS